MAALFLRGGLAARAQGYIASAPYILWGERWGIAIFTV